MRVTVKFVIAGGGGGGELHRRANAGRPNADSPKCDWKNKKPRAYFSGPSADEMDI